MRDRTKAKQLGTHRIRMRLKDIEARLDGDKIKGTLPEELTVEQRQEYLAIYAKLAKLLSDADRFTVMKEKGGLFR